MAASQDTNEWRQIMERMNSEEILPFQQDYIKLGKCTLSLEAWAQGLVVRSLEATHGQWLYKNLHVHDMVAGVTAMVCKE